MPCCSSATEDKSVVKPVVATPVAAPIPKETFDAMKAEEAPKPTEVEIIEAPVPAAPVEEVAAPVEAAPVVVEAEQTHAADNAEVAPAAEHHECDHQAEPEKSEEKVEVPTEEPALESSAVGCFC